MSPNHPILKGRRAFLGLRCRAFVDCRIHVLLGLGLLLFSPIRFAPVFAENPATVPTPDAGSDEKPEVEKITDTDSSVSIRGLQTVSEDDAREWIEFQLDYIEENGVSPARADDAAFFLESALLDRGYEDARVQVELPSPNRIVLDVEEGGLLRLAAVISTGNSAISNEGLFELISADTRDRLDLDFDLPIPYVENDIEAGHRHIVDYYRLLGYAAVEVTVLEPQVDPDPPGRKVSVKLRIDEGKVHRVGALDIGSPPDADLAAEFEKIRAEYADDLYSPALEAQIEARLRDTATDAGYYEADLTVAASPARAAGPGYISQVEKKEESEVDADRGEERGVMLVDLRVTRAEYGRKYTVRSLKVSGNERVKDRYFDRMFEEVTGEPFQPDKATKVVSDMLRSGAFRRVTAVPEKVEGGDAQIDLLVEVEEAARQEFGLFGGYGSYEGGIVGFEYRHLNLRGLVHRLDSRVELSQRGVTGNTTYTDPAFLWSDWQASFGILGNIRTHEGYSKIENGIRAELRRKLHRDDSVIFYLQSSYVDVFESEIDPEFLGDLDYLDSFAGVAYEIDHRDDLVSPRRGYFFRASNAIGHSVLGGDLDYVRSSLKFSYHYPIGPTTVHFGARGAAIFPSGDVDPDEGDLLPIDLRYFSGGANSVRSFPDRELGPSDSDGYPVGGEFTTTFNAEYEIPIVGPLSLAVFADAGNLLYRVEDASFDDMHYAAGVGLRFHSPLGPLRLDYGHNLNRQEGEPSGAFHIGFGVAF